MPNSSLMPKHGHHVPGHVRWPRSMSLAAPVVMVLHTTSSAARPPAWVRRSRPAAPPGYAVRNFSSSGIVQGVAQRALGMGDDGDLAARARHSSACPPPWRDPPRGRPPCFFSNSVRTVPFFSVPAMTSSKDGQQILLVDQPCGPCARPAGRPRSPGWPGRRPRSRRWPGRSFSG